MVLFLCKFFHIVLVFFDVFTIAAIYIVNEQEDKDMSNRPKITAVLSKSIQYHICPNNDPRIYWAREVTFDYATAYPVRVDFMKFKPVNQTVSGIEKGDFYCYEVKSSVADFHSKNGHNFLGDYNYYVMPREVYEKVQKEIPYFVGVYVPCGEINDNGYHRLENIRKARRKDRHRPISEMLLMMFRSAARDRKTEEIKVTPVDSQSKTKPEAEDVLDIWK